MNDEQSLERSGILLSVTPIPQELMRPPSNQAGVVVYESDGGGEGSDGSEGTGDY